MWSDPSNEGSLIDEILVYLFLLVALLTIGLVGLLVLGGGA